MPDTVMTMEAPQPMAAGYQRRSAEFDKLAAALAKAQGAMENAKKDSENPAFKRGDKISKYADLASVWDAIRKPLSDNGLSVMQWPRTVDKGVEIETELLHESGQFMRDTLWLPCPQMTVHSVGSTITYGRRYALMSIAGIAPEDDDGNAAVEAHKAGAPGSAGAGADFRPAGPRKFTGKSWTDDDPHLVDATREKGKLPAKEGIAIDTPAAARDAITHMQWIKDSRKLITDAKTKAELSDWWRQNAESRENAAAAVPVEYDKLIVHFDEKMTTVALAGA